MAWVGATVSTQVTIDGNNACSRCMTWLWMRGTANTKRKHILRGIGAFAARSGPVLLAAAFIRTTRKCKDKYGKLLVLVVFLHRNGCAGLLMRTARTARKGIARRTSARRFPCGGARGCAGRRWINLLFYTITSLGRRQQLLERAEEPQLD